MNIDLENKELIRIFQLFFDELPHQYEMKNTSRGDADFREAIIAKWSSGEKYVIKLSDNDFTFPKKIEAWKRCAEEYRKLGYYCPVIFSSKQGNYPIVTYKGHNCVVYVEEFCSYAIVEERCREDSKTGNTFDMKWADAAWMMTAKVAAKRFDFCDYPSAYCLFETFCPSDETDEVLENALAWKKYADHQPEKFQAQIQRIWERWMDNRNELEQIYNKLPTSVFQADLNSSNVLLDDNDAFVGIFDFNLCGKDVFLNYLFREIHWQYSEEYLLETLKKVSQAYSFSDLEKQAAPLLYRCLKPLWCTEIKTLQAAGNDEDAISACLMRTETLQTKEIAFASYMSADEGEKTPAHHFPKIL
ncbi:MAG: phosphotransferase [Candidatus Gastranaerophilales bacterium]|nr:phosphotransferase [Candidatus Gastranaerophilales bacterium]